MAPMPQESSLSMLRERASLQPNDPAFTFTDLRAGLGRRDRKSDVGTGVPQVAQRGVSRWRSTVSVGDRAVILAPQGLEYIVAFLGAMQAGLIAVPLSVPRSARMTSG